MVGSIDSDGDGRLDEFTLFLRVTVQPSGSTKDGLELLDAVQD